jgi:glycine dehydrogenase
MIEPTESEDVAELDRFVMRWFQFVKRLKHIDEPNNVLKKCTSFSDVNCWFLDITLFREKAAYPLDYVADNKFWPSVRRVDETYGTKFNL